MKVEIYQTGKLPPLTIIECNSWEYYYDDCCRPSVLKVFKGGQTIAVFNFNNIAGLKEVKE